jgi:hypothetical protein
MRLASRSAIALAGALTIAHLSAQQPPAQPPAGGGQRMGGMNMQDTAHKVPNGGIHGAGWQGRPDPGTGAVNDSSLDVKGSEIEIHTGPAMLYWNPANKGTGDFTVSATFTEPKYMSSNDHPHPYGVFIGGSNLDKENVNAMYCAAYGRGTFIVREFAPAVVNVNGRGAASDAVHKAAGRGEAVEQTIAMSVKGSRVTCSINGTEVASYDKGEVTGAGKIASTDGIVGIRVAHNVDVNVKDFKVTKQ